MGTGDRNKCGPDILLNMRFDQDESRASLHYFAIYIKTIWRADAQCAAAKCVRKVFCHVVGNSERCFRDRFVDEQIKEDEQYNK